MIEAEVAVEQAITQYDANRDGIIGADELEQAPAIKAALERLDTDGDGGVSGPEIAARIEAWQKSKVGRQSVICRVVYQGEALDGATVRFLPEKFLGNEMPAASGISDPTGTAIMGVGGADLPGVPCGLYRVTISKVVDGTETIPPEYNAKTTLGLEVAQDAPSAREAVRFELE